MRFHPCLQSRTSATSGPILLLHLAVQLPLLWQCSKHSNNQACRCGLPLCQTVQVSRGTKVHAHNATQNLAVAQEIYRLSGTSEPSSAHTSHQYHK